MESVWTDRQSWVIENRTTQNNTVNTKRTAQIVSQLAGSQARLPRDLTQFALVQFAAFYKCKILTNGTWLERDMNELCDGTRSVSVSTEVETEMWSTKHKVLFLLLPWAYIIRKKHTFTAVLAHLLWSQTSKIGTSRNILSKKAITMSSGWSFLSLKVPSYK